MKCIIKGNIKMHERPREEDGKSEIEAEDIFVDFSEFDIAVRKALWVLLKSIVDADQRQIVNGWLESYGKNFKECYQALQTKLTPFFTGDFLQEAKDLLNQMDSVVQMSGYQIRHLLMIEPHIYELLEKNRDLYNVIVLEANRRDSELSKLVDDFKDFLVSIDLGNSLIVENYFNKLDCDLKDSLWEALSSPFYADSREMAYNWINDGLGNIYYNAVIEFDTKLKTLLHGKLDEYRDAVTSLVQKSRKDPEEKIYKFFADNFAIFEYIHTELDKTDSLMVKILKEYKHFLNLPVYLDLHTLRGEHDRRHSKDEKTAPHLRNLGIFACPATVIPVINVCSVSFEKGLFNDTYYKTYRTNKARALINCNTHFFIHLVASTREEYREIIFMNGSLRQSFPADEFSLLVRHPSEPSRMLSSESCITALPTLANHVSSKINKHCKLDEYLLVDSFCDFEEGETFRAGVNKLADRAFESKALEGICVNDKSKVILLYAQMQKIAVQYKDDVIQFDFYSGDLQELQKIYIFFINNRVLKPHNVFLNLYLYNAAPLPNTKYVELKFQVDDYQSGTIDLDYKANLKIMLECLYLSDKDEKPLAATDDKIISRNPKQILAGSNTSMPATRTLEVSERFDAPAFKQKRVYNETIRLSRSDLRSAPMRLSTLR
jgi:hypothetical protein